MKDETKFDTLSWAEAAQGRGERVDSVQFYDDLLGICLYSDIAGIPHRCGLCTDPEGEGSE